MIFLTGIVAMIMLRDFAQRYHSNNSDHGNDELDVEETGWKYVHGDTFGTTSKRRAASVLVKAGVQILFTVVLLYPRGYGTPLPFPSLMCYHITSIGVLAGIISSRFYYVLDFGCLVAKIFCCCTSSKCSHLLSFSLESPFLWCMQEAIWQQFPPLGTSVLYFLRR